MAFWLGVWRIVHSRKMHGHCGTAYKLPHTSCIRWEFKSHLHFPSSLLLMRVLGDRQWWLQYSHWCGIPTLSSELLALAGSAPVGYTHLGSEPVGERSFSVSPLNLCVSPSLCKSAFFIRIKIYILNFIVKPLTGLCNWIFKEDWKDWRWI